MFLKIFAAFCEYNTRILLSRIKQNPLAEVAKWENVTNWWYYWFWGEILFQLMFNFHIICEDDVGKRQSYLSPWDKQKSVYKKLKPPEAIWLCDRPGHFFSIRVLTGSASGHTTVPQTGFFSIFFLVVLDQNVSGHTTVYQTGFFLKRYFRLGRQWPYPGLTYRVRGMVTDVPGQKRGKKKPVLWDRGMAIDVSFKNDRKKLEKTPVCEIEVSSLPDWVKNLNAGLCHP